MVRYRYFSGSLPSYGMMAMVMPVAECLNIKPLLCSVIFGNLDGVRGEVLPIYVDGSCLIGGGGGGWLCMCGTGLSFLVEG